MTSSTTIDPKHVLILGAGPGLGASIARRFGSEGFAVTLVARRQESLTALAEELRGSGVTVDTLTADAGDAHGFHHALESLAQRITPGVVVYNAAVIAADNVLTSDLDYLMDTYTVDVLGAISAAQVFIPAMRQAGTGTFLATGGSAAVKPYFGYATLALGKSALRAAASMLHDELQPEGVHAAGITVFGPIAVGTAADPDLIAETYWNLHTQPASEWSAETVVGIQ